MSRLILPPPEKPGKHNPALIDALEHISQAAILERNLHQIGWFITSGYLQGYRSFQIVNYDEGTVELEYDDPDESLGMPGVPFRWEKALADIQTEIGRLCRLDTRPNTKKRAFSLESLREASLARVFLDYLTRSTEHRSFYLDFLTQLVQYGTAAIGCWADSPQASLYSQDAPGVSVQWEIIPPWELLGIPAATSQPSDLRGICRSRMFPLRQLEQMQGVILPPKKYWGELNIQELPYGAVFDMQTSGAGTPAEGVGVSFSEMFDREARDQMDRAAEGKLGKPHRDFEEFVRLQEHWLVGPDWSVQRYIVRAGNWPAADTSYQKKVPCPVGIGKYQDTGHFYGRSFSSKVIPFVSRLERLLYRLIGNVEDMDRFGFLLMPMGMGMSEEDFIEKGTPRVIPYQYDPSFPRDPVQAVQPVNSSDLPGKVASFGVDMVDRSTNQGPLMGGQAPGRADSGEAFRVLAETGSTNLQAVAASIQKAYVSCYRWMLHHMSQALRDPAAVAATIPLARIDNTIMGVAVGPDGTISLEGGALPDPWNVQIEIMSTDPVRTERRRNEAIQLMQLGQLVPNELVIMNYREDWGLPLGKRAFYENYVKAVMHNLILFGDGRTPGPPEKAMPHDTFDIPAAQILALQEFTSTYEFSLASKEVQDIFRQRIRAWTPAAGGLLPQGMPNPEDAAAMQAQFAGGLPNVDLQSRITSRVQ